MPDTKIPVTAQVDLRVAHLFASLDEQQLEQVRAMSHPVFLREGESLFECGDEANRFFFVIGGQIKLYRLSPEGNEKVIDIIRPGSTFAEALMFLDNPTYPVYASALRDTMLISFENQRFLQLLRGSVETCLRVMGDMSQRLRRLIKEIDDLTLQSATSRVAAMLLHHMSTPEDTHFNLHAPKGVLASRLSVKPETFSRILHNLMDQEVINVKGGNVEVLDVDQLRQVANTDSVFGWEESDYLGPANIFPCSPKAKK